MVAALTTEAFEYSYVVDDLIAVGTGPIICGKPGFDFIEPRRPATNSRCRH